MPKEWTPIGKTSDLTPEKGKAFKVAGKNIAVFWIDGTYYAIENSCYHQGEPLDKGLVKDCIVTCPAHSWKFDLRSGECTRDDSIIMKTFSIKAEGDDLLVLI